MYSRWFASHTETHDSTVMVSASFLYFVSTIVSVIIGGFINAATASTTATAIK